MVSRYVNGPVKPEGICLLPPHPQHYRMMAHQRTDGYHVATPPYVQPQPQSQANNQVPPLRMQPTGHPTQSSTPPNTDLKVQSMTQQTPMNITYVPQARGPPQTQNYYRTQPPTTQAPRMANHRQGQQSIFQNPSTPFLPMPTMQPVYVNAQSNFYPRPPFVQQYQMIPSHNIYPYSQTQSQPPAYNYYGPIIQQRPPPSVTTAPPNTTQQPPPNMPLPQPPAIHSSVSKKKRSRAIPIINPLTGKELNEMFDQESEESLSHPPSGESSARETPQPPLPNPNKEVQAAFAKQVAQAISKDEVSAIEELDQPQIIEHMGLTLYPPPQAVHQRYDTIVQSSKLQAATKEFIPSALSIAKETTPVVSAITDAEEVTINTSNKQKDRESPAKGRKPREQATQREHKDSAKEAPLKDVLVEKSISCSKDEFKQKDLTVLNVGPTNNQDAPPPVSNQRDDKKIPKKDKVEVKQLPPSSSTAAFEDGSSDSVLVIPVSQSIPETPVANAKSKHNASQKVKEVQKPAAPPQQSPPPPPQQQQLPPTVTPPIPVIEQPVQQQPPAAAIPPSQPIKQANKSNKMRDLNIKGALKEGTDMDAFNDNVALEDATNANHSSSVNNEYVNINNTNNVMLNNNSNISTTVNDTKQTETNDIMTIKATPEIKSLPKSKIDVTDIVKDAPKLVKTIMPMPESEDEPDRAILDNDKLVQAKNDVNVKVSNDVESNVGDTKLNLPYREDQWSPFNQDGKKIYDKDFLLALRADPKSKQKPDNLPADIIASDDRGRVGEINRYPVGGRATDFAPNFSNNSYSSKSSSQRGSGMVTKRKSQSGTIGGSNKGSKQNMIRLSISVKEDVKLRESENAWKPARCIASATMTEDEKKTAELYKKVRGVLNKLTPQKFNTLVGQIKNFNIDTTERLQGVIDLVFEKAVDEPNFSVAYATLCGQLALMQVPAPASSNKKEEFVNFRKLLITRCQLEFEKNSIDESERNVKLKEIDECADPEKKKDLLLDLDDYDRRLRMKSVGNIRFIGELFKQNMLTVSIMMRCLNNLLNTKDEESLECLCKLVTTVGKELESKGENLSALFNTMKEIADKKHGRISSRVRFMIQDVIDLRLSKWIPRRQDLNPKTMDQIQREAETEQLNIQAMNSVPMPAGRRDERSSVVGSNMNTNNDKKRRNVSNNDDWSVASSRSNRVHQSFTINSDKLKITTVMTDEPLGNSQMFGSWGRGSNFKIQNQMAANNTNMYAALEVLETDKNSSIGLRPREFAMKGPSKERYNRQPYEEGRGSRSGSQHRSRDSSATAQRNMPPSASMPAPTPKPQTATSTPPPPTIELSPELIDRKMKNIIEEYLNDVCLKESDEELKQSIPASEHMNLVSTGYMFVVERSQTARCKTGSLFAYLIKTGTLTIYDYCMGLETFLMEAGELVIDIPMVWTYVAELIVPLIYENVLSLYNLDRALMWLINKGPAPKLLANIFNLIIHEKGPNYLQTNWNSSGQKFSNFMHESEVDSFLKNNGFEFMLGNDSGQISPNHSASFGQKKLSYEEIHDKLLEFFKSETSFDDIITWITANVGEAKTENQFLRVLTTAIFNFAIVNKKLKDDFLQGKYNYFHRFVDSNANYELQCLYSLQTLVHKLEYPQGLLLNICNRLYEDNIFSYESFLSWESSTDPAEQEGKGVALKQLTSFFTQMKEVDEESSSASDEEATAV